jgi:hypothetical protein
MRVRVVHRYAFGGCGGVEVAVGGDQRYRSETALLLEPLDFEEDSQLHGIVSPEAMLASRQHRLGKEGGGQFNDAVVPGQLAAELTENGSGLGDGEIAGVLPPGDRGRDLNGGDAGDIKRVTRLGADEGFDPRGCRLRSHGV